MIKWVLLFALALGFFVEETRYSYALGLFMGAATTFVWLDPFTRNQIISNTTISNATVIQE